MLRFYIFYKSLISKIYETQQLNNYTLLIRGFRNLCILLEDSRKNSYGICDMAPMCRSTDLLQSYSLCSYACFVASLKCTEQGKVLLTLTLIALLYEAHPWCLWLTSDVSGYPTRPAWQYLMLSCASCLARQGMFLNLLGKYHYC